MCYFYVLVSDIFLYFIKYVKDVYIIFQIVNINEYNILSKYI